LLPKERLLFARFIFKIYIYFLVIFNNKVKPFNHLIPQEFEKFKEDAEIKKQTKEMLCGRVNERKYYKYYGK